MGQGPMQFLSAAHEHDVLLAPLNQLCTMADAMGAGGAGGTDAVSYTHLDVDKRQVHSPR